MVITGPDGQDFVVAAGDPIPSDLLGYVENTPNRVDAAANYDDADAANKAATRPTETVIERFGSPADAAASAEIAARVAEGRQEFANEMDAAGAAAATPEPAPATTEQPTPAPEPESQKSAYDAALEADPGSKANREALNAYGASLGISNAADTEAFGTKADLRAAVDAKLAELKKG